MNRWAFISYYHQPNYIGFFEVTQRDHINTAAVQSFIKIRLEMKDAGYHTCKILDEPFYTRRYHVDMWRKDPNE